MTDAFVLARLLPFRKLEMNVSGVGSPNVIDADRRVISEKPFNPLNRATSPSAVTVAVSAPAPFGS